MTRSRIHMLTVAAARLEQDHANPKLVEALRKAATEEAEKLADGRGWTAEDTKRVERHRTLFNMLPSSNATDRLRAAMLQWAYDLMWDGNCSGCDAVLEFLPSTDCERLLDAWENDQDPHKPKSAFHATEGK